jgi:hypothetical protein
MRTFVYERATEPETAVHLAAVAKINGVGKPAEYLAGGPRMVLVRLGREIFAPIFL